MDLEREVKKIKKISEENNREIKEIKKMVKDVKRSLFWSKVWSILKILIIVVPIILGIIYLPPIISDYIQEVKDKFGISQVEQNMDQLPPEVKQYLK